MPGRFLGGFSDMRSRRERATRQVGAPPGRWRGLDQVALVQGTCPGGSWAVSLTCALVESAPPSQGGAPPGRWRGLDEAAVVQGTCPGGSWAVSLTCALVESAPPGRWVRRQAGGAATMRPQWCRAHAWAVLGRFL